MQYNILIEFWCYQLTHNSINSRSMNMTTHSEEKNKRKCKNAFHKKETLFVITTLKAQFNVGIFYVILELR